MFRKTKLQTNIILSLLAAHLFLYCNSMLTSFADSEFLEFLIRTNESKQKTDLPD